MNELQNFIQARNNETEREFLNQAHLVYRDFKAEESEQGVTLRALWRDPGLSQPRKFRDERGNEIYVQKGTGEDYFSNDNIAREYSPLLNEPGLFLEFAELAGSIPRGERGKRELAVDWIKSDGKEIALDWIKKYGVIGQSGTHQNVLVFWDEVETAKKSLLRYEAATTSSGRQLQDLGLEGRDIEGKRKKARLDLQKTLNSKLRNECYPVQHFYSIQNSEILCGARLSWRFRSLLGAMYLQLSWRVSSRICEAPRCNNIILRTARSDKKTCSKACKERRRVN